MLENIERTW